MGKRYAPGKDKVKVEFHGVIFLIETFKGKETLGKKQK